MLLNNKEARKKEAAKYALSPTYFMLSQVGRRKGNKQYQDANTTSKEQRPLNESHPDQVIQKIKNINKNLPKINPK